MIIKIFTRPGCMGCKQEKRLLGEKGISFEEIDISTPEGEALAATGVTMLPVTQILSDEGVLHQQFVGFRPDEIFKAIKNFA